MGKVAPPAEGSQSGKGEQAAKVIQTNFAQTAQDKGKGKGPARIAPKGEDMYSAPEVPAGQKLRVKNLMPIVGLKELQHFFDDYEVTVKSVKIRDMSFGDRAGSGV